MSAEMKTGILKRAVQVFVMLGVQAVILFLSAGRLDWVWAWVFLGLYLLGVLVNAYLMLRLNPENIAERAKGAGIRRWDALFGGLYIVMYILIEPAVAGLDFRYNWTSSLVLGFHLAGAVIYALGFALLIWSMAANAYFATIVRIQEERGHTVCDTGPYRYVRHPGYVGGIIQALAVPFVLGSLWALIPGAVAVLGMVLRTTMEDRTLQVELDGYREYTRRTRYRLLPGVW
jgi:protein-S-isoprenylcysteine O-methyltransferase Ste14